MKSKLHLRQQRSKANRTVYGKLVRRLWTHDPEKLEVFLRQFATAPQCVIDALETDACKRGETCIWQAITDKVAHGAFEEYDRLHRIALAFPGDN